LGPSIAVRQQPDKIASVGHARRRHGLNTDLAPAPFRATPLNKAPQETGDTGKAGMCVSVQDRAP
jgi:hypothetical protein